VSNVVRPTSRTVAELAALPREVQIEVFLGLPPPAAEDFQGEFVGRSPAYLAGDTDAYYREIGLGAWLGKGYLIEGHGRWSGHGYNLWGGDGSGVKRCMRFGWEMGRSVIDGGPCLLMHYRAFANAFGEFDLVDEIRRVDDGVYLGLAMTREPTPLCPEPDGPEGRTQPSTFFLSGPSRPWVGSDDPAAEAPAPR
jgi:hypothetical protein